MNGVVTGGWEYVILAWSATAIALIIYGVTLVTRLRDAKSRVARMGETK
jgi:uncharacterized membrane protein YidH (DUF202 family)